MITIGFSTKKLDLEFKQHLIDSCGVRGAEVIHIENNGEYSLTEAYNILLKQSTNDIVVLCHDDIYFDTKNWGKRLLNHFKKTEYGILGVAGSTEMSDSGVWWNDRNRMVGIVNHEKEDKKWVSNYSMDLKNNIAEVCVIDGLFIALSKGRIHNHFNEDIKDFHFYDVDFSFSNHINSVKVGVIFNVRITHKSVGMTNESWEKNKEQFINIWNSKLPHKLIPSITFSEKPKIKNEKYKISVVIPTKDNFDVLKNCINSFFEKCTYKNITYYIADTGSSDNEINKINDFVENDSRLKLIRYDYYNFAKINNDVVNNHITSDTEILLFCNDDIVLINDVVSHMLKTYIDNKSAVGTIGARLHYEDGLIQHSGIMALIKGGRLLLGHYGMKTYYDYHRTNTNVLGNTAALLMINKNLFDNINGFNEEYIECFEDVELNVMCLLKGKKNIINPNAVAYHLESHTRKKNKERTDNENIDFKNRVLSLFIENSEKLKQYFYVT